MKVVSPGVAQYAQVNPVWSGETAVVLGGGPSLTQEQVTMCAALPTVAVNDAYLLAPWADVLYFADARWYEWHKDREQFKAFAGLKVTIQHDAGVTFNPKDYEDVFGLKNYAEVNGACLSDSNDGLSSGTASGYQAINLAYLAGAKRILLLGFDAAESHGKMHWFGDHPIPTSRSWLMGMPFQMQRLATALEKRGVEAINCSPDSVLTCFRKQGLESALNNL